MVPPWRRRRATSQARKKNETGALELVIPSHFRCPISLEFMKDPVALSTGMTYDRGSIEAWIEAGNRTCPITNLPLTSLEPIPNHAIRKMIQDWCVENRSYGVERIPTPRVPVTSFQVQEFVSKVAVAQQRNDGEMCLELAVKIKDLAMESERNRRCMGANGTGRALSEAFKVFSEGHFEMNIAILKEILSAALLFFPLDEEAKSCFRSYPSLNSIVNCLKSGDLSLQTNATIVLKEVLSSDPMNINDFAETEGGLEALVMLIKEQIFPTTSKASLMTIYHMVSSTVIPNSTKKITERFLEMGLVSLLLEILVNSERSVTEIALGVLDEICNFDKGREIAFNNSLTTPVLVKKLLRVSKLSTEFSVSILWKLGKNEKREDGGVLVEALQVGAFQKLLLLLQVGCGERTKEEASELLKLLNGHREMLECIDSMDFKDLKRPF